MAQRRRYTLASYARQSHDDELEKLSIRIRSRAIRRCGELLKLFDGKGKRNDLEPKAGAQPKLTQGEAPERAGLSKHQVKQSVNMANIMAADFEALVEADKPESPSKIAERGRREYLSKPKPEGLQGNSIFYGAENELFFAVLGTYVESTQKGVIYIDLHVDPTRLKWLINVIRGIFIDPVGTM